MGGAVGIHANSACAQAVPLASHSEPQNPGENGEMAKASVDFTLTYNSDLNADIAGGARTGAAYLQRVGFIADVSLDKIIGWQGAKLHVSVHAINGTGLSGHFVGNLLTVSGIEAEPALRLFNLWVEQDLGSGASLRAGQFTAGQEFMISSTAAHFVNSTFGWPGSFATDLPSGGPAYPLAAPGVRLAVKPDAETTIRLGIFAGDPAGPGQGDPQRRDLHGFNAFRFHGAPFVIGEVGRSFSDDVPVSVTLGGWVHFGRFADLAPVSNKAGINGPDAERGNYAVYGLVDAQLWVTGPRSLHAFVRGSASPSDRNPMDLYLDTGLSLQAPFRARPDDTLGLAVAFGRISPRLRPHSTGRATAPRLESAVELTYQAKLGSSFYIQPSLQWIIHPAGELLTAVPSDAKPVRNAIVAGLRTSMTF